MSPRGRPVNADAAQTRQRMIDAATRLFSEQGVASTSVRQIANESRVSVAMVSHVFGGKDGLVEACTADMYEKLAAIQSEMLEVLSLGGREVIVSEGVRRLYRFARRHRTQIRLILRMVVDRGGLDPVRQEQTVRPFLAAASAAFAGERPAEELRFPLQTMTFAIARYATAGVEELAMVADLTPDDPEAVHAAVEEHLVDLAHRALGVPKPV